MKRDFDLMDNLLDGIENADSKNEMMMDDPAIQAADNALMNVMEKIQGTVPKDAIDEICEAAVGYANAVGTFNLLYGMHVIRTMVEFARNPSDISRHILDHMNRERAS